MFGFPLEKGRRASVSHTWSDASMLDGTSVEFGVSPTRYGTGKQESLLQ
jgi:hypothetical protein